LLIVGQIPAVIKLSSSVYQRDYMTRDKLIAEIFPQADCLVLVPPKSEGFGMVVLEAASLEIPSIVTSVYALPEIVKNGKTGFVIQPKNLGQLVDAIEVFIKDYALKKEMGKAARDNFMKNFWIKKTNEKLLEVYEIAIG